jgi:hypothetical protein
MEPSPTYFIKNRERVSGPLEIGNLRTLLERGPISEKTEVSSSEAGPWRSFARLERDLQATSATHQLKLKEKAAPIEKSDSRGGATAPIHLADIIAMANQVCPKAGLARPNRIRNDVEIMVATIAETARKNEAQLVLDDRRKGRNRNYLCFLVIFNTLLGAPLGWVLRSGVMANQLNGILFVTLFAVLVLTNIKVYWNLCHVGSKY